jgi:2-dehydrotetronate isomerase
MPKFAANLSFLYGEHAFLDRFAAAASDGFRAVEFLFPYEETAEKIAATAKAAGVSIVLFNLPPGDWAKGERGLAALQGREAEFDAALATALDYAKILDCPRVHAMAGRVEDGADFATYLANLRRAAPIAAAQGRSLTIEPINTRDVPGYFLNRQDEAHAIREAVGSPALGVQMDLYHCQIVEGDVARKIEKYLSGVSHMQLAGVPDRHEPSEGELNYPYLFELIDRLGYAGHIGCEYRPRAGTSAGLGWLKPYLT